MTKDKLTTSEVNVSGQKFEPLPQLTPEQKALQKEQDKKVLESYNVQIDQLRLEILKLEKALNLDLPTREVRAQVENMQEQLSKFLQFKKIIEERNK